VSAAGSAGAGHTASDVADAEGGLCRLSAETREGAIVEVLTGPAATIVSGQTGCMLRDGGPGRGRWAGGAPLHAGGWRSRWVWSKGPCAR